MSYVTRSGSELRLDGRKFRFIGFNFYPGIIDEYSQSAIETLFNQAIAKGVNVFRMWCFDKGGQNDNLPTNSEGNFRYLSGGELLWREETFAHLDLVLDIARQKGIKIILSLADDPTYQTKNVYLKWSDSLYGTDYNTPVSKSVTGITRTNNVCTATTSAAHGFSVGQLVDVAGATPSDMNGSAIFVASVPTDTTFTYSATGSNGSATGTLTVIRNSSYKTQNFYRDNNIKTLYKEFFAQLANRVNTINGRTYKEDDSIFSWEMGNELRYDQTNDPNINTLNSHNLEIISGTTTGWAREMADYFKSIDSNHLVSYGSMAHKWQWVDGDTISNGTYYGVDYDLLSSIDSIDYLDFHIYPSDGTTLKKYGQRLGYPNAVTGAGFRAQLKNFIDIGHNNSKPVICSEVGFVKSDTPNNSYYPLYPRSNGLSNVIKDFFEIGGDGLMIWSATSNPTSSSYDISLAPETSNTDDVLTMSIVYQRNYNIKGRRIPVDAVNGVSI